MAYTKTNWVNGTTPLNDTNMNKIENALENLDTNISKSTDEYSSTRTYSIGELVIYNNKLYKANQDITTAEAFNSSHWTEVTLLSDVNEIKSVVNNNADNLNKMDEVINAKQDKLTAGTGIEIKDNTINNTQTSAEWGNIKGTLSSQTDLKTELDKRDEEYTLYENPSGSTGDIVLSDSRENYDYIKVFVDFGDYVTSSETNTNKIGIFGLVINEDGLYTKSVILSFNGLNCTKVSNYSALNRANEYVRYGTDMNKVIKIVGYK